MTGAARKRRLDLHPSCLLQMRFGLRQLRRDITCRLSSNMGGLFLHDSITISSEI